MSLTNEDLLAISNILDKRMNSMENRMENKIQTSVDGLRQEVAKDIGGLKQDMEEVKHGILLLRIDNENNIIPRLQNIEACYTATYNRYKDSVETYEEMQEDIKLLKQVVGEHSEKLQKIS